MTADAVIDARTAEVIRSATEAARSGRFAEACEIGQRGLAQGCEPASLHAMIGWFLIREGKHEPAADHLFAAHERRPTDPLIARNLATALLGCSRYADTVRMLTEELVAKDADLDLLRLRGFAAQMAGDFAASVEAYARVVERYPLDWETWNNLGNAKLSDGDAAGALAVLRRAARLNPSAGIVRINLARTLRRSGMPTEAAAELRLAADAAPDDPQPLVELADLLRTSFGDEEGAAKALEQAAVRDPSNPDLLAGLGYQQLLTMAFDEAEATFERALELRPDHAHAFLGLGDVFEHRRPEQLSLLTTRAAAARVGPAALSLLKAMCALRDRDHQAGIAALDIVPDDFEPELRWRLEGQLRDRAGDHAGAFDAFARMNAAQAADPSEPVRRAAELRGKLRGELDLMTAEWRDRWCSSPSEGDAPIFLLGFPRSGTTLLDTMLMGHPRLTVMEERPVMNQLFAEIGGMEAIPAMDDGDVRRARRRYFELASAYVPLGAHTTLVDKSPLHLQRVSQIVRLFPNARFILALRHPADVVLSCFMASFRLNSSMANFLRLDTTAEFYDLSFAMWEQARSLFDIDVRTVVYEKLIENPEAELKPVVEGLGLDWSPDVIDHQRSASSRGLISTASYAQVGQPLYRTAAARWRHYREHLEPVLPVLEPWIAALGYGPLELAQSANARRTLQIADQSR